MSTVSAAPSPSWITPPTCATGSVNGQVCGSESRAASSSFTLTVGEPDVMEPPCTGWSVARAAGLIGMDQLCSVEVDEGAFDLHGAAAGNLDATVSDQDRRAPHLEEELGAGGDVHGLPSVDVDGRSGQGHAGVGRARERASLDVDGAILTGELEPLR